jgi:arylamine N-acetyltransferase
MQSSRARSSDSVFTLDNYLSRVGLSGFKCEPTYEVLKTIIEHHFATFHYHNRLLYEAGKVTPEEKRNPPSMVIDDIFAAMINTGGGYCFQQLELMAAVLLAAGFKVDRHLAKIVLQPSSRIQPDKPGFPKTHELLIVHLQGERFMVDVGMANLSLRLPIKLQEGVVTLFDSEQYQLIKSGDLWTLDTKYTKDENWFRMYDFFNTPVEQKQIEEAHKILYSSKHHIPIRDDMRLFGKMTPTKRKYILRYNDDVNAGEYFSIRLNGEKARHLELKTEEELEAQVKKKFKI